MSKIWVVGVSGKMKMFKTEYFGQLLESARYL